MRLIVIKVNADVVNGGVLSAEIGIFNEGDTQPTIRMYVSKYNMIKNHGEIKVGQELKLVPADATVVK